MNLASKTRYGSWIKLEMRLELDKCTVLCWTLYEVCLFMIKMKRQLWDMLSMLNDLEITTLWTRLTWFWPHVVPTQVIMNSVFLTTPIMKPWASALQNRCLGLLAYKTVTLEFSIFSCFEVTLQAFLPINMYQCRFMFGSNTDARESVFSSVFSFMTIITNVDVQQVEWWACKDTYGALLK